MAENKTKIITGVLFTIIAIVIILNFIGSGSSTELIEASNSITQANNCSGTDAAGIELFYNATANSCQNSSGNGTYTPTSHAMPLATLFSSQGIAIVILMAGILLGLIGLAIKKAKGGL